MMLYVVLIEDSLLVNGDGSVCYYPSAHDAKRAATHHQSSRVLSVAERQKEVDRAGQQGFARPTPD